MKKLFKVLVATVSQWMADQEHWCSCPQSLCWDQTGKGELAAPMSTHKPPSCCVFQWDSPACLKYPLAQTRATLSSHDSESKKNQQKKAHHFHGIIPHPWDWLPQQYYVTQIRTLLIKVKVNQKPHTPSFPVEWRLCALWSTQGCPSHMTFKPISATRIFSLQIKSANRIPPFGKRWVRGFLPPFSS